MTVLLHRGIQQLLCQLLGGANLRNGQALGILTFDHIVIHLLIDVVFEFLVELRSRGHVVQESCIVAVGADKHGKGCQQNDHHQKADRHHQLAQPALERFRFFHRLFFPAR